MNHSNCLHRVLYRSFSGTGMSPSEDLIVGLFESEKNLLCKRVFSKRIGLIINVRIWKILLELLSRGLFSTRHIFLLGVLWNFQKAPFVWNCVLNAIGFTPLKQQRCSLRPNEDSKIRTQPN